MNESIPPIIPEQDQPNHMEPPLGSRPGDKEAINSPIAAMEALLRQPRRLVYQLKQPGAARLIGALMLITLFCGAIYGLVAGTFSGGGQLWIAPVKITCGILFSALICLPSLYIFASLGGAQTRLLEAGGLLAGLTALMSVLLAGFAPVAWVFSESTNALPIIGALHILFGFVAVVFGLRFLMSGFVLCEVTNRIGIQFWGLVFILVLLQMTASLRPIIGKADTFLPKEKKFFLVHWANCVDSEVNRVRDSEKPAVETR